MSAFLDRIADAGGLLYVLLVGIGFAALVAPSLPESLDAPDAVLAHLRDHPPTTSLWLGLWLEAAGLAALVLLIARVAGRIRAADPTGWVPSAAVGLAVAAFTVKIASFPAALAALHVDRYDAGTVTALLDVNGAAVDVSWALDGAATLLLGLGTLAVRALPRWLAALTVTAGAAALVGTAAPVAFDVLQLAFLLWLPVISGWLLLRGGRAPAAGAERAGAVADAR